MTRLIPALALWLGLTGMTPGQDAFADLQVEAIVDSTALLSKEVSPGMLQVLRARGTPEVRTRAELRHEVIFEGRFVQAFGVAASVTAAEMETWQRHKGSVARVYFVAAPRDGRPLVSALLASSSP